MGLLSMESLPLGFRFRPTDAELINHYLRLKINGRHSEVQVIPEVDVCKWEPWDLPRLSVIKTDDPEWFFFCPRDRKYSNGHRSNRATNAGYWKATGKGRMIKTRKSSPSGYSNPQLIGMKKTLVFYRGRAPKGERTNWIMHEYRATEPDLDGTASDQAAYVLCRLFWKPDEKPDNSKYDEVDPSGSSPTTVKSSPDDTSSDLFQEQGLLDMELGKQPEGMKRWLTDKSDAMTSNSHVHVESCMSNADDQSTGAAATEVYPLLGRDPMCQQTIDGHDWKVFSHLHSCYKTDIACPDSPFADDFGSNHIGLHFQDGTSEQDVSLTELLDNLQNHDEYPCEESTSQKISDIGSKSLLSGKIGWLNEGPAKSENLPVFGLFTETNNNMFQGQVQILPQLVHAQVSDHKAEFGMSLCSLRDEYAGKDVSSDDSMMRSLYNPQQTCEHKNPASHGSNIEVGSGIRIRQRQPRNQASPENLLTQGTAARRIRLQKDYPDASLYRGESSDANSFTNEKQEEESIITKVSEVSKSRSMCDEPKVGSIISDHRKAAQEQEGRAGLGLRNNKPDTEADGARMRSMFSWGPLYGFCGTKLKRVCAVSLYIIVVLSVIFVGISKCPSFRALHS